MTARTLRRDIDRLRGASATRSPARPARYGGYELGAGGRLPPLVLDDDEAVAVAIALAELSRRSALPLEECSDRRAGRSWIRCCRRALRERGRGAGRASPRATADVQRSAAEPGRRPGARRPRPRLPPPGAEALHLPRRQQPRRLPAGGAASARRAQPALVPRRVRPRPQGLAQLPPRLGPARAWSTPARRFVHTDPPDAARFVAEGVAVGGYTTQARSRLLLPPDRRSGDPAGRQTDRARRRPRRGRRWCASAATWIGWPVPRRARVPVRGARAAGAQAELRAPARRCCATTATDIRWWGSWVSAVRKPSSSTSKPWRTR